MQGNQEEETESQKPRVSHPSEAGRRIKEPGGKQKGNNKESVIPESYLPIYLSTYLPIYLSVCLSIKEPMGTWKNTTSTTKSPSRNLNATLKKP